MSSCWAGCRATKNVTVCGYPSNFPSSRRACGSILIRPPVVSDSPVWRCAPAAPSWPWLKQIETRLGICRLRRNLALRRPPVNLLVDTPAKIVVDSLPSVVPLNLDVRPAAPCLNVLVPGMAMHAMTGGPNTIINLTYRMAAAGVPVRYISTCNEMDRDHEPLWNHFQSLTGIRERLPNVEIVSAYNRSRPALIGADDVFFGTAWWTVQMIKHALPMMRHKKFLYIIQDFEPAQGCEACYNTGGWKKISSQAVNERFDHSKTKFPLEGKHAGVGCAQCHANGDFKKPLVFQKCMDCHKPDPHNGQFAKRPGGGECASCHTVQGWKPSTFTVKEHATSAYPLQGKHATVDCAKCHIPKGKDTLFKVKFDRCTDCHADQHAGQFVAAPYFNACDRCHNLDGYKPSTFGLARHKETHFVLTGGHLAVPCSDCHKESVEFQTKPTAIYHWKNLNCASCHADPHKGQFKERMQQTRADGSVAGCEACHTTKSWKELSGFDHSKAKFPLLERTARRPASIATSLPILKRS